MKWFQKRRAVLVCLILAFAGTGIVIVACVQEPSVTRNHSSEAKAGGSEVKGEGGKFTDPRVCGACHTIQYTQWLGSMHRYAQASIINELVSDFVTKQFGETAGEFCTTCHTPIGSAMGEPYDMPGKDRSPLSLAGVSCDVCHSIDKAYGASQGYLGLKPSNKVYGPHGKGGEKDPPPVKVDFHVAEQRDVFKSSQMCQHCHEVTAPNALRLQETYSEWQMSPWAKEGVTCQSCHMGPVPGRPSEYPMGQIAEVADLELPERPLSNHSFIGVDYHWTDEYPLRGRGGKTPGARTKRRNTKIQEQLTTKRQELMRNAAQLHVTGPKTLPPGGKGTLAVRIENTHSGHHFPTGFPWRQAWLEVVYTDAAGKVFFQSGDLDSNRDLRNQFSADVNAGKIEEDPYLANLQSQATVRGFRGIEVELPFPIAAEDAPAPTIFPAVSPQAVYNGADNARIVKRGIPARASRTFVYPLRTPDDVAGTVSYRVRLLFRNFPAYYLDYFVRYYPAHKGLLATLKAKLQIYEVDTVSGTIQIGQGTKGSTGGTTPYSDEARER